MTFRIDNVRGYEFMNSFTLPYKMNNQIAFLARVTPETSLDIFIFLSGTFTYTVTDEKRWNDMRLPDSLLKKGRGEA